MKNSVIEVQRASARKARTVLAIAGSVMVGVAAIAAASFSYGSPETVKVPAVPVLSPVARVETPQIAELKNSVSELARSVKDELRLRRKQEYARWRASLFEKLGQRTSSIVYDLKESWTDVRIQQLAAEAEALQREVEATKDKLTSLTSEVANYDSLEKTVASHGIAIGNINANLQERPLLNEVERLIGVSARQLENLLEKSDQSDPNEQVKRRKAEEDVASLQRILGEQRLKIEDLEKRMGLLNTRAVVPTAPPVSQPVQPACRTIWGRSLCPPQQ